MTCRYQNPEARGALTAQEKGCREQSRMAVRKWRIFLTFFLSLTAPYTTQPQIIMQEGSKCNLLHMPHGRLAKFIEIGLLVLN